MEEHQFYSGGPLPLSSLPWLATFLLTSGMAGFGARPLPPSLSPGALSAGDIIYADSGNAVDGGFVVKIDRASGEQVVLSSGGFLIQPFDLVLDPAGAILVSDTSGRLIRLDPATGAQTLLLDNADGGLGMPCGICLDGRGGILVANTQSILRVDLATDEVTTIASGGNLRAPIGVAAMSPGEFFVLNAGSPPQIIRANPRNGTQRVISEGGYLTNPQAITLVGDSIYVTDVATSDGNFGIGRVLRVDAHTGEQMVLAEGENLIGPVGIASDDNGDLLIGDPYTINPESPDLFDGGIIRVNVATGSQTLLVRGTSGHVNPRGLTAVPSLTLPQLR